MEKKNEVEKFPSFNQRRKTSSARVLPQLSNLPSSHVKFPLNSFLMIKTKAEKTQLNLTFFRLLSPAELTDDSIMVYLLLLFDSFTVVVLSRLARWEVIYYIVRKKTKKNGKIFDRRPEEFFVAFNIIFHNMELVPQIERVNSKLTQWEKWIKSPRAQLDLRTSSADEFFRTQNDFFSFFTNKNIYLFFRFHQKSLRFM